MTYSIDDIKRAADIAAAYAGINWEVLDTEPGAADYFTKSLEYGVKRLSLVESIYRKRVLEYVDKDTGLLDLEAADISLDEADILAEELHACYSMKGILDTFKAVQEITNSVPPVKKKRAPRKKRKPEGE